MQTLSDTNQTSGKPGPNTDSGKAFSSRNALKHGLFATHDFIRLGERDEYDAFAAAFRDQLAPEGPLEELFVTEVIAANWRLRRCRLVEEDFSAKFDEIDPMQDVEGAKIQRSIDRARAQAHSTIRRALAEIRKLQTERRIRAELKMGQNRGIAEFPKILAALAKVGIQCESDPDSFCNQESQPDSTGEAGAPQGSKSQESGTPTELQSPKIAA